MRLFQPRLAVVLTLVAVGIFVAMSVVYLTPLTPPQVFHEAGDVSTLFFVLPYSGFALIGGLIAARRPANPVGWCVLGGALCLGIGALADLMCSVLTHDGNAAGAWIGLGGAFWASGVSPTTGLFVAAMLLFPDGRFLSRWWRLLLLSAIALGALSLVAGAVNPSSSALGIGYVDDPSVNPPSPLALSGADGFASAVELVSTIGAYVIQGLAVVSVLLRLRGADSDRRHQVRWFATGLVITIVTSLAPGLLSFPNSPGAGQIAIASVLGLSSGLALPACAAVAIFRYRLYDIDVFISRALVYAVLAVFITAVYVSIVVGIGTAIGSGASPNLGLSILATAIVAAGFQPLRERMQRTANRLVYGRRATPYEVLSELSSTLRSTTEAEDVLPRMARLLREGTGAELAVVWAKRGRALHPAGVAPAGAPVAAAVLLDGEHVAAIDGMNLTVPVTHHGELLGALSLGGRRGEAFGQGETKLVRDLALQAGPVLKNAGLTEELLQRLDDLSASRRRLVSAQDDERRRLERNLHDGAQQHLVAIKVKLTLAAQLVRRDPAAAVEAVRGLKADADDALDTLRSLARGIYPPLLAERGLVAALRSQANKSTLPVMVEDSGVGRYSQDVEGTVYFCCLEALQNAQKYAKGSSVAVRLAEDGGVLRFEVIDDGAGFDREHVARGAGLTNMTDRIDALGGSLEVWSAPGQGAAVRGSVPVEAAVAA